MNKQKQAENDDWEESVKILKVGYSLVPRRSRLGQSWTLPWAVTSPRDTRQVKYGGPFVRLLQLQPKVAENRSFEQE